MPRDFTNWKNQYISLIEANQHNIVSPVSNHVGEPEQLIINERISRYSKLTVELGSGSGSHLVEQAKLAPNSLCIGFELRFKRAFLTAQRAERHGVKNFLVVRADAKDVTKIFPIESISTLYINFPDPWEKRKWRKHRLLATEFLTTLVPLLRKGGVLSIKTDHQDSFEEAYSAIKSIPELHIEIESKDLFNSPWNEGNVVTEFESLFHSKGLPIFCVRAKKLGGQDQAHV